jgi:hypothetical protein
MKKVICSVLAALILLAFAACGATPESSTPPPRETPGNVSPTNAGGVIHMAKKLCDDLEIDADIAIPTTANFSTYKANPVTLSPDALVSLFFAEGDREIAQTENVDELHLTMKHGQQIFAGNGQIGYWSETYKRDVEIFDLLQSYGEAHPQEQAHVLPFMTPDEAIEYGKELIAKIGITGTPVVRDSKMMGLPAAEIMAWQQTLLKDENYKQWSDIGKTIILEDLTENEDAYAISFSFEYQGVRIFKQADEPNPSFASATMNISSVRVDMLITKNGIRYFSLAGGLSANGTESSPEAILTYEQALKKVTEKYETSIHSEPQHITEVWLEYLPLSDPNSHSLDAPVTLTPYWCFVLGETYTDTNGQQTMRRTNAERINAFTGEDLAYGW